MYGTPDCPLSGMTDVHRLILSKLLYFNEYVTEGSKEKRKHGKYITRLVKAKIFSFTAQPLPA